MDGDFNFEKSDDDFEDGDDGDDLRGWDGDDDDDFDSGDDDDDGWGGDGVDLDVWDDEGDSDDVDTTINVGDGGNDDDVVVGNDGVVDNETGDDDAVGFCKVDRDDWRARDGDGGRVKSVLTRVWLDGDDGSEGDFERVWCCDWGDDDELTDDDTE